MRDKVEIGPSSPAGRMQLLRLLELIMAIQSDRFPNARTLAERCEVSRRTIFRDLEILTAAGIPVQYRSDRQGYQLTRGCSIPTPSLEEKEALALLVLARQWKGGTGMGLIQHARTGVAKVVQSLPPEVRSRVLIWAEPIPDESNAPPPPGDRKRVHDAILDALGERLQIRIWYRDPAGGSLETTKLALYRLVLAQGVWYVVGRSTLHREVRVFRIPWIERVTPTNDPYTIPPRFDLERFLGMAWGMERGKERHEVRLRFSARLAPEIVESHWHRSQRLVELPDRRAELYLQVDGLDEIERWVLGFGDQVEVLAPQVLRERICAIAARMADQHADHCLSSFNTAHP